MPPTELTERDNLLYRFLIVQDTLLYLNRVTYKKDLVLERNVYAEGLVMKASLQLLTIRNVFEGGEWFSALSNRPYNYIIDPLSVASVLRGAYECMLTLHHVFVDPLSQDEVELRYLLWVLETFISKNQAEPTEFEEGKLARDQNRKNIDETVNYLMELSIVQSLDSQSQTTIKGKSDPRTGDGWQYYVEGIKLKRVEGGWHGLANRMPAREKVFTNLYKLFSLNSHPTWHSINVVVNGFEGDDPENFRMMDTMLTMSAMIGIFILYDYCTLFKDVRKAFHQLPPHIQEVVNNLIVTFKGDGFML
ncbi:hypothetical protein [Spirosoma endophyticum]|uniref:Uncharacterized protein n=1 Tax=Spirosoma endophyticum TaxID=662367 RepID=A0A1I2B7C5_9BACT|nr:hypothetical protein [Spirosoma endophyticum]SFE52054.1 hypothetical protein SAMN05216167_11514 [Spirosoma endophyticum]